MKMNMVDLELTLLLERPVVLPYVTPITKLADYFLLNIVD